MDSCYLCHSESAGSRCSDQCNNIRSVGTWLGDCSVGIDVLVSCGYHDLCVLCAFLLQSWCRWGARNGLCVQ